MRSMVEGAVQTPYLPRSYEGPARAVGHGSNRANMKMAEEVYPELTGMPDDHVAALLCRVEERSPGIGVRLLELVRMPLGSPDRREEYAAIYRDMLPLVMIEYGAEGGKRIEMFEVILAKIGSYVARRSRAN